MSAIGPEPADPSGGARTGPTGAEPAEDARDASPPAGAGPAGVNAARFELAGPGPVVAGPVGTESAGAGRVGAGSTSPASWNPEGPRSAGPGEAGADSSDHEGTRYQQRWAEPAGGGPQTPPGVVEAPADRPSRGRQAVVALAVAVVVFALGAPLGLLWHRLAPTVPIIKTADGAMYATPSPEQFIAADGWFTLLGVGFGVLASVACWIMLRRYRGPVGLLAVAAGAVGAGWLAWQVGREIGRDAFRRQAESAAAGTLLHRPPDLRAGGFEWLWNVLPTVHGDLLMPAFGAVVAYTLLAGWSRYASLRPEAETRAEPAPAGDRESPEPVSWGWQAPQAPAAAPGPPGSDAAEPPRG